MSKFWYLVKYSLKRRIKTKSFVIANIIMAILLIGIINLPTIIKKFGGDFDDTKVYYVFDETNKAYNYMNSSIVEGMNLQLELQEDSFNIENKKSLLKKCDGILVLSFQDEILKMEIYANDISLTQETYLTNLVTIAKSAIWEETASEEVIDQVTTLLTSPIIDKHLKNKEDSSEKAILGMVSTIIILPLFIFIVMMMQFVGTEILEEKSSRSIEYIISNIEPGKHFGSKIISAIIFVVVQFLILFVAGVLGVVISNVIGDGFANSISSVGASAAEVNIIGDITSKIPSMLAVIFLFCILGYALYLVLIAVFSSMATSLEDFQQFQTPVMICIMVAFYISIFGMNFEGSLFIKKMGYIPLFSPMLAPVLFINGTFGLMEVIIAALILIVLDIVVVKFGVPLYRVSILDYSQDRLFAKFKKMIKKSKYK